MAKKIKIYNDGDRPVQVHVFYFVSENQDAPKENFFPVPKKDEKCFDLGDNPVLGIFVKETEGANPQSVITERKSVKGTDKCENDPEEYKVSHEYCWNFPCLADDKKTIQEISLKAVEMSDAK